jgi:hypothetical protein
VKCALAPLGVKAKETEVHTSLDTGGQAMITEIRVKGENIRHIF